jgi:hypothetical protein
MLDAKTTENRAEYYHSLADAAEQAAVTSSDEYLRSTWLRIAECCRELYRLREHNRLVRPRIP